MSPLVRRVLLPVFFSLTAAHATPVAASSAAPTAAATPAATAPVAPDAAPAVAAADQTTFFDPDRCAAGKACSVNGSALLVILRFNWQLGLSNI